MDPWSSSGFGFPSPLSLYVIIFNKFSFLINYWYILTYIHKLYFISNSRVAFVANFFERKLTNSKIWQQKIHNNIIKYNSVQYLQLKAKIIKGNISFRSQWLHMFLSASNGIKSAVYNYFDFTRLFFKIIFP